MKIFLNSKYHSMSVLGPQRPVLFYERKVDLCLCFWNGILMTQKQGLLVASEIFFDIYPTPKMKEEVFKEFSLLQYLADLGGGICDPKCYTASSHYNYLFKKVKPEAHKIKKNVSGYEVLQWFNTKEIKEVAHD